MNYTILLVDDHTMVRQGLRTLLEKVGYIIVAEAESGEHAYLAWRKHQPDLMLLDLDMPGIGGLECLKHILAQNKNARILVYSMYDDSVHASRAMQAGACGYVAKSDAPELLLDAVQRVLRGEHFIGHEVALQIALQRFSGMDKPIETLSPREFEVFRRLVAGESLNEIAQHLHIGYKSAANFQTQIRQKLNAQTTEQLAQLAMRVGINLR